MSSRPIAPSADLRRLVDEGYSISLADGLLRVLDVPFVDAERTVGRGTISMPLALAGNVTAAPDFHVVHFSGGVPCDHLGRPLAELSVQAPPTRPPPTGGDRAGFGVDAVLCMKPVGREFADHHELVTAYVAVLSGHARLIDPAADARTRLPPVLRADGSDPFRYVDTASARVGTAGLNGRLAGGSVAIVGLGGTGSYVLDLVAKTPVRAIHLFDDDVLLQHNAFRAPGAPTLDELAAGRSKVDHFAE